MANESGQNCVNYLFVIRCLINQFRRVHCSFRPVLLHGFDIIKGVLRSVCSSKKAANQVVCIKVSYCQHLTIKYINISLPNESRKRK